MKTSTLWLLVGLTASVSGQSNNLLSVLISDAVSIFTSVTSVVGSQVSAASASQLASATSTSDSSTTSTSTSATPSSTSSTSQSSTSSLSTITSAPATASSSASSAASNNANDGHHDRNLAIILGTVLGALVLGLLILFLLLLCRRRRQRSKMDSGYKGYNSSSDDIVAHEKSSHLKSGSNSFVHQPRTFQQYHRGSQDVHNAGKYPNHIPAAHGMSDQPFVPGVPTYSQDGRMHDHERGGLMSFDEKRPSYGHLERVPLAAGFGGVGLRGNDRENHGNSRASNIVPDEYPYHSIQPPARSPHRLSMDSAERRRRSASLGREGVRTPTHHLHDPMPRSTGLVAGALAGTAPSRDRRRTRSQPRNPDSVSSGLVSPIMRSEDSTAVHEMGDSSDDRDIDRLRRTGTLSQGPKSRPKVAELHELSSTGSSNIVPTLGNLSDNRNSINNNYRQSYPQYQSATAPAMERTDNLHPAPLDESHWMHKGVHDGKLGQIIPTENKNINPASHALSSHLVREPNQNVTTRTHTPNLQQPSSALQSTEGSSLVSGILKIRDQSNERPTHSNITTRPLLLNRTSTEERRRLRARRRSSPGYNHPIISGSSSSNTEAIAPLYPSQPNSDLTTIRPISQSNISQPLHPRSTQHQQQQPLHSFSPGATLPSDHNSISNVNPNANPHARPQLIPPRSVNEFNNIPDQGAIGRWNSRGRWKSTENIHDDVVGQAL